MEFNAILQRMIMKIFLVWFLGSFFINDISDYQVTLLKIEVTNIRNTQGKIWVAVYNKEEGFLKKEKAVTHASVPAVKGSVQIEINNLQPGTYAVVVFHDANNNSELDKNIFGVPKEYYGFSNGVKGSFGPPKFKDCSFYFDGMQNISIKLK